MKVMRDFVDDVELEEEWLRIEQTNDVVNMTDLFDEYYPTIVNAIDFVDANFFNYFINAIS